jgi:hypothetical protein
MIRHLKRLLKIHEDGLIVSKSKKLDDNVNERMISLSFQLQELEKLEMILNPFLQITKHDVRSAQMTRTELNTLIWKRSIIILVQDSMDVIQSSMSRMTQLFG